MEHDTSRHPLESYLYRDKQSDLLSRTGAFVAHLYDRSINHGPITFSGLDKLKEAEPNLIAPTHQSSIDISVVGWAARRAKLVPPAFIAKVGLVSDRPLSGRLLPYAGAFYIEQSKRDHAHIERHINEKLSTGRSVVMFPEGTRRRAGENMKLEKGLGIIAVNLGLVVSPVGIYVPEGSEALRNSPVGVVVGDKLAAGKNPIKFRRELMEVLTDLREQAKDLAGY